MTLKEGKSIEQPTYSYLTCTRQPETIHIEPREVIIIAEAVMERYTRVLKPMHLQFIEPCKRYADLIVPEGGSNRVAIDILTMYIKKHLKN